jgi:hypothetical protein
MQFRNIAFGNRYDPHAGKVHLFVEARNMLLIAAYPIERFRKDNIKPPSAGMRDQLLEARTTSRGPADGVVGEDIHHRPAFLVGAGTAYPDLVLDRDRTLAIDE